MEPKTAFIPRKSVTDVSLSGSSRASIISLVIVAFFILSCLVGAGVFGYGMLLDRTIENRQEALNDFQEQLREPIVTEIKTVAARLAAANNRLTNHMAVSQVFTSLNEITLRNVRWRTMRFEFQPTSILLTLDGEAKTFASVALQAEQFTAEKLYLNPIISNLDASTEAGVGARFAFRANISPELLSYDALIKELTTPVDPLGDGSAGTAAGVVVDDGSGTSTVGVQATLPN